MTGPTTPDLSAIRAWVLDVDGCLVRTARAGGAGGTAMPRAAELLAALQAAGHTVVVCTNASERTPQQYAAHLRELGIPVSDDAFVTAGSAAADHVATHHPGATVLVVGADGIAGPLRELGVEQVDAEDAEHAAAADVVVVGAARSFTTAEINAACLAVDSGAPLYTTVASPWFHGGLGRSVAISTAIANAIGWTTGVTPHVLGKPSASLAETLVRRLGVRPDQIAVVGDAAAEIRLARLMGATSVLVLSGATATHDLVGAEASVRPDVVLSDVAALYDLLSATLPMTQGAL